MTWRNFETNPDTYEGPPPAVAERADDAQFDGDFATLVALFRTQLASEAVTGGRGAARAAYRFAQQLKHLAALMLDGWGSPEALFPQQCFDDHGPAILLRALAKAYEQPAHVLTTQVDHP